MDQHSQSVISFCIKTSNREKELEPLSSSSGSTGLGSGLSALEDSRICTYAGLFWKSRDGEGIKRAREHVYWVWALGPLPSCTSILNIIFWLLKSCLQQQWPLALQNHLLGAEFKDQVLKKSGCHEEGGN